MNDTAIFRAEEWYDNAGRHITSRTPFDGGAVLYTGYSRGQIKDVSGQGVNIDYFFDIEAESVVAAFGVYDEVMRARWPEVVEQYKTDVNKQRSQIQRATALDKAIIAGGNGKGGFKFRK